MKNWQYEIRYPRIEDNRRIFYLAKRQFENIIVEYSFISLSRRFTIKIPEELWGEKWYYLGNKQCTDCFDQEPILPEKPPWSEVIPRNKTMMSMIQNMDQRAPGGYIDVEHMTPNEEIVVVIHQVVPLSYYQAHDRSYEFTISDKLCVVPVGDRKNDFHEIQPLDSKILRHEVSFAFPEYYI
jgi:hypothetical protein